MYYVLYCVSYYFCDDREFEAFESKEIFLGSYKERGLNTYNDHREREMHNNHMRRLI
jgi:guanylate kinase